MKLLFICHMTQNTLDDTVRAIRYLGKELTYRGHEVDYFFRRGQPDQPVSMLEWPMRVAPLAARKCRQKAYDLILATESSGWCLSSFRDWLFPPQTRIVSWRSGSGQPAMAPEPDEPMTALSFEDSKKLLTRQLSHWTIEQSLKTQDGCFLTSLDEVHRIRDSHPTASSKVLYQPRGVASYFYSSERFKQKASRPSRLLFIGNREISPATGEVLSTTLRKLKSIHPKVTLTVAGAHLPQADELFSGFPADVQPCLNRVAVEEEAILPALYLQHDVLIQPQNTPGLPLAVLEAMASAMPAVVAQNPDFPEVVTHYESGLIVPPDDANALVESVSHLLENPGLCRELGEAAFETVSRCYTWHQVCDIFEANLTRIARQPVS